MSLDKELPKLVAANVISPEIAERIAAHYKEKEIDSADSKASRMLLIFGSIGAALVGLGLMLIVAHNWDDLARSTKTVIVFVPLLLGQLLCGYSLFTGKSSAWREAAATFLMFAVGACIALISQIYHLPGRLDQFMLVWLLLSIPLVYIMPSSVVSVLCWLGSSYFVWETGYAYTYNDLAYFYWLLFVLLLPHYYLLLQRKPGSNFTTIHHLLVPVSLLIAAGTIGGKGNDKWLLLLVYVSLLGIFYNLFIYLKQQRIVATSYKLIGASGTTIILLVSTFKDFWRELAQDAIAYSSVEFAVALLLLAVGLLLFWRSHRSDKQPLLHVHPLALIFLIYPLLFFLGRFAEAAPMAVALNLLVLGIGVYIVQQGVQADNLNQLNSGLLTIAALVACRFFDSDISFVVRGLLFIAVGVSFVAANYYLLKQRKVHGR